MSSIRGQQHSIFSMSLKRFSLLTLILQNTALGVVMHHSRVSAPSGKAYFFPTAVLLTELLKCFVSFAIAVFSTHLAADPSSLPLRNRDTHPTYSNSPNAPIWKTRTSSSPSAQDTITNMTYRISCVLSELVSVDYWKLSIPALLYVLQNNLQFVAVSNLEPPVFICAYQMKILTTAFFSILILRKRLGFWQWTSLAMLAVGVAIVQLQSNTVSGLVPFEVHSHGYGHISAGPVADLPPPPPPPPFDAHGAPPPERPLFSTPQHHDKPPSKEYNVFPPSSPSFPGMRISMSMEESERSDRTLQPLKGFAAVVVACFTSGLAGVYFELVLKTSPTNLWTRNVQLSAWSILPAAIPVILDALKNGAAAPFRHFGASAWATVILQVTGGLAVAMVIKHADNILKGFAVSFSIILSFAISVTFFNFPMSVAFVLGAALVILSTVSYSKSPNLGAALSAPVSLRTHHDLTQRNKALREEPEHYAHLEKITIGGGRAADTQNPFQIPKTF